MAIDLSKRLAISDKRAYDQAVKAHERISKIKDEKDKGNKEEKEKGTLNSNTKLLSIPRENSNPFDVENSFGGLQTVTPTNLPSLDLWLPCNVEQTERGFKDGAFHLVTADANNFKTSLMTRISINTLNTIGPVDSGHVYFIDVDGHFDTSFLTSKMSGTIRDHEVLTSGHFHYYNVNSFSEVYRHIANICLTWKEIINDYVLDFNSTTKKKIKPYQIWMPRDICKVTIIVDGFSTLFSETSMTKEVGEQTKTAEENTDSHRAFKLLNSSIKYLGIPVFLTNHYRSIIGVKSQFAPTKKPYQWESMQGYINTALDIWTANNKKKDVGGTTVVLSKDINCKIRKTKTRGHGLTASPIEFFMNKGFNVLGNYLQALDDCGFIVYKTVKQGGASVKTISIIPKNKFGRRLPKPLREFEVEDVALKDFLAWIKAPATLRAFLSAVTASLPRLIPLSVDESIRGAGEDISDDVLSGMEIEETEEENKEALSTLTDDLSEEELSNLEEVNNKMKDKIKSASQDLLEEEEVTDIPENAEEARRLLESMDDDSVENENPFAEED